MIRRFNIYQLIAYFGEYTYKEPFIASSSNEAKDAGKDFEAFINNDSPGGFRTRVTVTALEIKPYDFNIHRPMTQPTTIIWDSKG